MLLHQTDKKDWNPLDASRVFEGWMQQYLVHVCKEDSFQKNVEDQRQRILGCFQRAEESGWYEDCARGRKRCNPERTRRDWVS